MSLTLDSESDQHPADSTPDAPTSRGGHRNRALAILAVGVLGVIVAVVVVPRVWRSAAPHLYAGTVLQQSTPAPSLEALRFGDGSSVDLAAFDGDVVMLYFGYTGCPDICPTTMADAARAVEGLDAADAERVHLIMISVDDQRDDPATVQNYAEHFHPSFLGAGGEADDLMEAATRYGIFFQVHEPDDPNRPDVYDVDHTSTIMAIDTEGVLRVVWSPQVTSSEITADLAALLD